MYFFTLLFSVVAVHSKSNTLHPVTTKGACGRHTAFIKTFFIKRIKWLLELRELHNTFAFAHFLLHVGRHSELRSLFCPSLPALQTHGDAVFYYAHGEAGMSLHFPDDPTEMIVGAPGVYKWRGERTMHRTRETDICVLLLMLFPTVFFKSHLYSGLCVASYFVVVVFLFVFILFFYFVWIYYLFWLFCVWGVGCILQMEYHVSF